MVEAIDSERTCPVCGCAIEVTAVICATCGSKIKAEAEQQSTRLPDDDPSLQTVDPEHRVEVAHFEIDHGEEAELACGLLRANGIPCELGSPLLPGLPAEQGLWVNSGDAERAVKLLAEAERSSGEDDTKSTDAA
jgi:hypothetical protein